LISRPRRQLLCWQRDERDGVSIDMRDTQIAGIEMAR
jgi:hypothetical protein